jgi:HD-GYP domain-containing protein (c-di-GMP phosphodiesterase class II)
MALNVEGPPREGASVGQLPGRARPLLTLLSVLESRYRDLTNHGRTVGLYCRALAVRFDLDQDRLELAGTLHDVGKVAVSETVLRKPDSLTPDEWRQVKRHPEIGAQLLFEAELDDVATWVLAHHERPDGNGYPYGLRGSEIPLEAKILSVVDAFDAMTSERVYQPAQSVPAAVSELLRGAGSQFDSAVVAAFVATVERRSLFAPVLEVEQELPGLDKLHD